MKDPTGRLDLALRSLEGLWVGDCIGNIGQLYYAHDILRALDEGIVKFGADNINPNQRYFQFSDDTEEAIVLVNHLDKNKEIKQNELAAEFAKRYYERDPDGEIYGYGLMTRKVLTDIYNGVPWNVANQTKPRIEGPSSIDKMIRGVVEGKSINETMADLNAELQRELKNPKTFLKVGSCGNGSAMRVAPLGAYFFKNVDDVVEYAKLQSEVTHCHPEGIAGGTAVAVMTALIAEYQYNLTHEYQTIFGHGLGDDGAKPTKDDWYDLLLYNIPQSQVGDGIQKAKGLPLDTPIGKLIEILGNGTHVTCQDTVPLCIFLTIRALTQYKIEEMYEKVIIETCQCFGDVDTNCAIVGGMIGVISQPPDKWIRYCQPMEGLLEELPEKQERRPSSKKEQKFAIKDALKNTKVYSVTKDNFRDEELQNSIIEDQADSLFETSKVISQAINKKPPTFEEVLEARKKELGKL